MSKRPGSLQKSGRPIKSREEKLMLESLRAHGQVKESDDPDTPLGPGQTHLYVKKPGEKTGYLIEKRKSLINR